MSNARSVFDTDALADLVRQTWAGFSTTYLLMTIEQSGNAVSVLCRALFNIRHYQVSSACPHDIDELLNGQIDLYYEMWLSVRAELEIRNSYAPNLHSSQ